MYKNSTKRSNFAMQNHVSKVGQKLLKQDDYYECT